MKFSMIRIIPSLFILLSIAACNDSVTIVKPELDQEFKIEYGQKVTLTKEAITIQFTQLLEDSRCPKGVDCIWAGNAKIQIRVNKTPFELNTHRSFKTEAIISNYKIKLVAISPYPEYQNPVAEKDYSVTLLITKIE